MMALGLSMGLLYHNLRQDKAFAEEAQDGKNTEKEALYEQVKDQKGESEQNPQQKKKSML